MRLTRLASGPIIRPHMDAKMGSNINGPSLVRAPSWVPNPLGKYYLYFADHDGDYIRLAYADDLEGPWQMHEPGTLGLEQSAFAGRIASPDVHVDEERQEVRMYFHGAETKSGVPSDQFTRLACSSDGLNFAAAKENLGPAYFRVFPWQGAFYALAMPGLILRSEDGRTEFGRGPMAFSRAMRHSAVLVRDSKALVVFTNVGDNPEQLLASQVELSGPWSEWVATAPTFALAPDEDYEGGDCPPEPSRRGLVNNRVRQLRDPALFDDDGTIYVLYAIAGEAGIAITRIDDFGDVLA